MMRFFRLAAITTLGLASAAAAAQQAPSTYLLSATLTDGSRVVARPSLKVEAGHPATIEIGNEAGHYRVVMTATPRADGTILVASDIDADSHVNGHHAARPVMTVAPEHVSAIEFGDDSATSKPFRVEFVLKPVAA